MPDTGTGRTAQPVEWPTVAMLCLAYGGWTIAGLWLYPEAPVAALAAMAVFAALHSSLQHEALHGHPTRKAWLNELLVSLPLSVAYPYRRFRTLHLRHHADERLTDPYDDPESYYLARADWASLSRPMQALLTFNNTLLGRIIVGPPLMVFGFWRAELRLALAGDAEVRRAWIIHLLALSVLFAVVTQGFGIGAWQYAFTAWMAMSIIAVRTYCEHRWAERVQGRTIVVENARLLSWLFLNNNLHLVHHTHPTAPWYRLPALYRARKDEWAAMNGGYVFASYLDILRRWAVSAKEPVEHPALRRQANPGRAFRPRMRVTASAGRGAAPVPANRPDE